MSGSKKCSGFWQCVHDACWITGLLIFLLSFAIPYGEREHFPPFPSLLLFAVFYIVVAEWAGYAARRAARLEWYERVGRNWPADPDAQREQFRRAPKSVKKDIYL